MDTLAQRLWLTWPGFILRPEPYSLGLRALHPNRESPPHAQPAFSVEVPCSVGAQH
jgi:hypothetical protein